jgi:hypothetical protein
LASVARIVVSRGLSVLTGPPHPMGNERNQPGPGILFDRIGAALKEE